MIYIQKQILLYTNFSPAISLVLVTLLGLVLLALIYSHLLKSHTPKLAKTVWNSSIGWLWILLTTSSALILGRYGIVGLFAVLSIWAAIEYQRATKTHPRVFGSLTTIAVLFQYTFVVTNKHSYFTFFIPVALFFCLALIQVLRQDVKGFTHKIGVIYWGLLLCVFNLSHVAHIINLDDLSTLRYEPFEMLVFLLVMTQLGDVFQFIFGKWLGKRKILPKVSPQKTVAGFLGGLVSVTVISSFVGPYLIDMSWQESCVAGLLIAFGGFLGDATLSGIKRDHKLKDFGRGIKGHGGILDRLDSLLIAGPLFFYYCQFVVKY